MHHYAVSIPASAGGVGSLPGVVYEPGPPRRMFAPPAYEDLLPVAVLAHGFTGNTAMMSSLARRLARAGYAVVSFDFRGHGQNPVPFTSDRSTLRDDFDAAVLFARTQRHYDPERVAILGHSMGAFVALDYASYRADLGAVVAISGGAAPSGPYDPPNPLLIWAEGDPKPMRNLLRETGAVLAGLEQLVLGETYGEFARGSAVRASEVDGVDHLTILYSDALAAHARDWLENSIGPGTAAVQISGDGRFAWAGLGIAAGIVVLWGLIGWLSPLLPIFPGASVATPLRALGVFALALTLALLLLVGIDGSGAGSPFAAIPFVAARDLIGFYAISGALLCVWLFRIGALRAPGLGLRTWGGAGLLLGLSVLVFGSMLSAFVGLWPAAHRLPGIAASALLMLPFYAAFEFLLRPNADTPIWLPLAGRVLTLGAVLGGALLGILPFFLLMTVIGFVGLFALFELLGQRALRVAPNPWLIAIYQAAFSAWALGAIFPYGPA